MPASNMVLVNHSIINIDAGVIQGILHITVASEILDPDVLMASAHTQILIW
jgi:hypothetical protein